MQLDADALARQLVEAGAPGDAGGNALPGRARPRHRRVEAKEAQDAQIVFGDARGGIADEAHMRRAATSASPPT